MSPLPRTVTVHLDAAARLAADAVDLEQRRAARLRAEWAIEFGETLGVPRGESAAYFEAAVARCTVLGLIPGPGAEDSSRGLQLPGLMRR